MSPSPEDCFEETCADCSKKMWCGCCGYADAYPAPVRPDPDIDYCNCSSMPIFISRAIMENSKEPLDWVTPMLNLWRPPQGYITDNDENNETTAVLMMLLEGMLHDEFPENKLLFIDCCTKVWEDNLELGWKESKEVNIDDEK